MPPPRTHGEHPTAVHRLVPRAVENREGRTVANPAEPSLLNRTRPRRSLARRRSRTGRPFVVPGPEQASTGRVAHLAGHPAAEGAAHPSVGEGGLRIMDDIEAALRWALGLGTQGKELGMGQMALRAVVLYVVTLLMVRLGKKRFMGQSTAFDVILGIMLGSIVS